MQSHDAYGTPPKWFVEFVGVIADTLREVLGTEWSQEIEQAWQKLLGELDRLLSQAGD
jgi:hemoglobin-like flavoprotein